MQTVASRYALCRLEDLADGEARGFDLMNEGRDALFVVRRGNDLRAYRNRCPHQGASLPWRRHAYLDKDGSHIVCSAHGAKFDIDSGRCVLGPALGQSLDTVHLSTDDDGIVNVSWLQPAGQE